MKTTQTKPEGLVDFNLDLHLHLVNSFMTKNEEAMYAFNNHVGAAMPKSAGIRMAFDIVLVTSLIQTENRATYLTYGPSVSGMELPLSSNRQIAGVLDDELWFGEDGKYFSASDELQARKAMFDAISAPLKDAFKGLQQSMEELLKDLRKEHSEGEEWKD